MKQNEYFIKIIYLSIYFTHLNKFVKNVTPLFEWCINGAQVRRVVFLYWVTIIVQIFTYVIAQPLTNHKSRHYYLHLQVWVQSRGFSPY